MTRRTDRAWTLYLGACRAAVAAASRAQRRLAERLDGRGLPVDRALALLTAGFIIAAVLGFRFAFPVHIGAPSLAGAADPVVVFKNPHDATLWLCDKDIASCEGEGQGHLTINEEVSGLPAGVGLGSFEFLIYYNETTIDVSVAEGPFLGSTGRQTNCSTLSGEGWLRFGCVSWGGQHGPSGSGILAYIEVDPNPDLVIRPTSRNIVLVNLLNSSLDVELADELGNPIPIDMVGSAAISVRALEGDVNYDCKVNVIDEQAVSGRYGTGFGIWPYNMFYDLEPVIADFDIDIKDLQFVYGRDGRTCEEPEQPQGTPTPTPLSATATPSPGTGTPGTSTPTPATGTPLPSPTPLPATATPSPGTGTPGTSTPTPATGTPLPSPTPRPHDTHTPTPTAVARTATPTGSPGPATSTPSSGGTGTPTPSPGGVLTPTPGPGGGTAPAEGTPRPGGEIAPEGRVPGEAEGLPGAGVGPYQTVSNDYLMLLIAVLAVGGWSVLAGMLYCRETQLLEQPVLSKRERRGSARGRTS